MWHPEVLRFVARTQKTISTSLMQDAMSSVSVRGPVKSWIFGRGVEREGFCSRSLDSERA